jgi:hypothetical protein
MNTYYVYVTEQCNNDAVKHSVTKDIANLAEKIESEQSDRGLDHYPPPYRKKVMGRPGRLVIEEHRYDDDIVLCFARYFTRGSSEYEAFYKDTAKYHEKNKVPEEEIEAFLRERKKKPINNRLQLTEAELSYLQSSRANHYTDDGAFLESYDWFERISQGWAKDYLSRYYDLLLELESGKISEQSNIITHKKNINIKILYRYFPEYKRTFLIAPIDGRIDNDEKILQDRYSAILVSETVTMDDLIRNSRRAYPSIITYDEDIWVLVEKSVEANLALSPEEESILESVMNNGIEDVKYPLFINGRPGSGKSTILQYLFADHIVRFIGLRKHSGNDDPPLYLTYSTPLLEQARSSVENIINCGASNIENSLSIISGNELDEILRICFRNFREFLRSLLPKDIKRKFSHANYVDFNRFKKLWSDKSNKHPVQNVRGIGSELGWHAIRTFIKGMQHESGSGVDPEYYELELARDAKSLSDKTFKIIYEHVWEKWYEPLCRENGYWDDQDLARAVLDFVDGNISRYLAVFCDEAQDFTTIELELIERLSIYSERQIPSYLVKNVPFAFAGDPFQTLNPTGFNWSTMQSSFHDNIVQQLDPNGAAKLEFNFQELAFNYRSSEHIVKLANLVQLLRAVLLRIKGLKPQQCWTRKSTVSPAWFRRDDANFQSALREQGELVIIIPCQENGELEYAENDPFLKSMAIKNGEISRNILSPARAKGLEYDRVLLYGFGDEAILRLPDLLNQIHDPGIEPPEIEQRLAWEYFLNQFYVAVSRARKRLFVVDSSYGIDRFWSFIDVSYQKVLLDLYNRPEEWSKEDLGGTVKGDTSSWFDDRDDPLELARKWQEQGHAQRDPYLLRLAKDNYERAGRPEDAKLCEARQYEYEGEFDKAAKLFTKLRQSDDACRCYWANKDFVSLVRIAEEFTEITSDSRFISASAISRDRNSASQIDAVLTAIEKITPTPFPDMPDEIDAWRWFFSIFAQKTGDAIEASGRQMNEWQPYVYRFIKTIIRFELSLSSYPEVARLLYISGDPKSAVEYWNNHCQGQKDTSRDKWLVRARAELEPYPANIRFYYELDDYKSVILQWHLVDCILNDETPINFLFDSAIKIFDHDSIRILLPLVDDLGKIITALSLDEKSSLQNYVGALPVAIAHSLEARRDWGQLIGFVSNQSTNNRQLNSIIKESSIKWSKEVLISAAVRVMAQSKYLSNEGSKTQKEVSEFLKQHLIIEKDSKRSQQALVVSIFDLIDIVEAGAAFERAFRLTYVLEFYEQFFMKNHLAHRVLQPTKTQEIFAKKRWILCKHRLGKTQLGRGSEMHSDEAREMEREWRINVDEEPEYPVLKPLKELNIVLSAASKDKIRQKSGAENETKIRFTAVTEDNDKYKSSEVIILKFNNYQIAGKILTRKKRIILTDIETEDQVTCGPENVTSNDLDVVKKNDTEYLKIWEITHWGILCKIELDNNRMLISFSLDDGVQISVYEFH